MVKTSKFAGFVVKDIMTPSITSISDEDRVLDVFKLFEERHITAMPVVNPQNEYVGVVSKTDFCNLRTVNLLLQHASNVDSLKVRDVLTSTSLITIDENSLVEEASDLMLSKRIHRVFVKNGDNKITGVLSSYDIMKVMATCGTLNEMSALQQSCFFCGSSLEQ